MVSARRISHPTSSAGRRRGAQGSGGELAVSSIAPLLLGSSRCGDQASPARRRRSRSSQGPARRQSCASKPSPKPSDPPRVSALIHRSIELVTGPPLSARRALLYGPSPVPPLCRFMSSHHIVGCKRARPGARRRASPRTRRPAARARAAAAQSWSSRSQSTTSGSRPPGPGAAAGSSARPLGLRVRQPSLTRRTAARCRAARCSAAHARARPLPARSVAGAGGAARDAARGPRMGSRERVCAECEQPGASQRPGSPASLLAPHLKRPSSSPSCGRGGPVRPAARRLRGRAARRTRLEVAGLGGGVAGAVVALQLVHRGALPRGPAAERAARVAAARQPPVLRHDHARPRGVLHPARPASRVYGGPTGFRCSPCTPRSPGLASSGGSRLPSGACARARGAAPRPLRCSRCAGAPGARELALTAAVGALRAAPGRQHRIPCSPTGAHAAPRARPVAAAPE